MAEQLAGNKFWCNRAHIHRQIGKVIPFTPFVDRRRNQIFACTSFTGDQYGNILGGSFHDVLDHGSHFQIKRRMPSNSTATTSFAVPDEPPRSGTVERAVLSIRARSSVSSTGCLSHSHGRLRILIISGSFTSESTIALVPTWFFRNFFKVRTGVEHSDGAAMVFHTTTSYELWLWLSNAVCRFVADSMIKSVPSRRLINA